MGGQGYPIGLRQNEIPIEVRIVTLVDVFDALRSERPYKPAFPLEQCLKIIHDGAGTFFDPDVIKAFDASINSVEEIYGLWGDHIIKRNADLKSVVSDSNQSE